MLADGIATGTSPAPAYPPPAGLGFIAGGGHGPDTDQAAAVAASGQAAMFASPVGEGRGPGDPGDYRSPQVFVSHPRLIDAINTSAVGDDTASESLPGRIVPLVGWDGELSGGPSA